MTLAPADMLCFALYSTAHAVQSAYAPLLEPLGLTYPQYLVLAALAAAPDRRVSDLGQELQLATNTLTPLLKRMEAAGWLTRRRDSGDERQVRLQLTAAGQALAARAAGVPAAFAARTGLDMAEMAGLRDLLGQLRARLKPAKPPTKSAGLAARDAQEGPQA